VRPFRLHVVLASLTAFACGEAPPTPVLTNEAKAEIAAEVEAAARSWWSAWQTMDFELGMSFVSDQPEAVWVGDDGILQGKMRMREAWTEWAADIREQTNRRTEVTFVVLSSDLAFVTLKFTNASSTLMSGTVTPERSVFETLFFHLIFLTTIYLPPFIGRSGPVPWLFPFEDTPRSASSSGSA
jgi:ketosteroid isomerase-like protein